MIYLEIGNEKPVFLNSNLQQGQKHKEQDNIEY